MSWKRTEYFTEKSEANSTSIDTVYYNKDSHRLWVKFLNGNLAGYSGVTQAVYNEFKGAVSLGRYYNNWIKGQYPGLNSDVNLQQTNENVVAIKTNYEYEVEYVTTDTLKVSASSEIEALNRAKTALGDGVVIKSVKRFV